ncbi:MAG: vacuolar sorting protein VPS33/slp1 [Bathelium mastoideum]|nr:MAG: vacuolar sorting protein VPS33/slp1 [Bathelium mastoideum]KAI9686146.1 MAG: vacuolar sorting protein VPS33/slp1 [Bathelium mastoideum]
MALSIIQAQRDIILGTIRDTVRGEWKVLIVDEASQKVLDSVVKEDDILNLNITNIERIENRRQTNRDMDALYFLSPQAHIVDCVMADFERRRYRKSFLIWTALLPPALRERIDRSKMAREQIALFKIVGVCVALGEYPTIRYYRPKDPRHEASVLCSHLARFVQEELDMYAKYHEDFPPPSTRPRGTLYILDRSMDLFAPFLHEFTYQAMAHDLLPIKDGEKVTFRTVTEEGRPDSEKDVEISEKDKIWVENRHRHMKDTIEKLMGDFQKFIDENPHFANQTGNEAKNNLNVIKDMLAGLPQFQELKEAYSLHLTMAQDCMNIFEHNKLPDLASVEQILATGLDEDFKKPKNVADQVVRNLDEDSVSHPDRLRLIALYLLYRDGLLPADLQKLLAHSNLPSRDSEVINNLELLGARVSKPLKDKSTFQPLFPRKQQAPTAAQEEYSLSRFNPVLQTMLEEHVRNTLDQSLFPYTKPPLDDSDAQNAALAATSLRSAKPTWAKPRTGGADARQRVIVFVAGGATYSESRACYEVARRAQREVVLVTSHMLSPGLFMRQLGDLGVDKRKLGIPAEQPKPKAPAHLFEREDATALSPQVSAVSSSSQLSQQQSQVSQASGQRPLPPGGGLPKGPAPPTRQMAGMNVGPPRPPAQNGGAVPQRSNAAMTAANAAANGQTGQPVGKLQKDPDDKKRKKHHFFGSKK